MAFLCRTLSALSMLISRFLWVSQRALITDIFGIKLSEDPVTFPCGQGANYLFFGNSFVFHCLVDNYALKKYNYFDSQFVINDSFSA